jgi:ATP-dependent DNA helicase PIF1
MGLNWKKHVIKPTLLFSKNADVDSINEKNLQALKKPLRTFSATTTVGPKTEEGADLDLPSKEQVDLLTNRLDLDSSYCPTLELCEGCQVMLLTNLDVEAGLVNGSRGVILEFTTDGLPVVQFLKGGPKTIEHHSWVSPEHSGIARRQVPLRVAYAITIHKSQGATLDCALVDIGDSTFEYGQAYVALSRVRDLESLFVYALDPTKIMAHPSVKAFYDGLL